MSEETTTTQPQTPQAPETGVAPAVKALFNGATEEDFADRMEILSGFSTYNRTVTGLRFPKELRDVVAAFLEAGGVGGCVCIDETADHQFCTARFKTDDNAQASAYRQFLDDMVAFDFVGRCLSAGTFPRDAEQVVKFVDGLAADRAASAADARPPDALEFPDVSECLVNAAQTVLDHFFRGAPPTYFFYEGDGEDGDWRPPATIDEWDRRAYDSDEDEMPAPGVKNDFGAVMDAIYQLFKFTEDVTVDSRAVGRLPSLAAIEVLLDELGRRPPRPASFRTGGEWDDRPLFFELGNYNPMSHGLAMRTVQQGEYLPDDFGPLMRSTPTHERCYVGNSPMRYYFSEDAGDLSSLYKKQRWPIAALVAGEEALSRINPAALLAAGNPDDFRKYVGDLVIEWLRLGGLDGDFAAVFAHGSHIGFSNLSLLRLSPDMTRRWSGDAEDSDLTSAWWKNCCSASERILQFMSVQSLAGILYERKSEYPCSGREPPPDSSDWVYDTDNKDSQTQQQAAFLKHAIDTAAVATFVFAIVRKEMLRDAPALPRQAFRVETVQRKPDIVPVKQEKDDTVVNVGGLAREWRHLTHGLPASYLTYDPTEDDSSGALKSCCPPDEASLDLFPFFRGPLDCNTRRVAMTHDCNYAPRMDRFLRALLSVLATHDISDDITKYLAGSSRSSDRNHRYDVIIPAVYSGMTVQNPSESAPSTPVFYVPDDVVAASWRTLASSSAPNITEWSKWLDKHPAAMDACRLRKKENGGTRYAWTVVETNLVYDKCLTAARIHARAQFSDDVLSEDDDPLLALLAAAYVDEMTSFVPNGDKGNPAMVNRDAFFNARVRMKWVTSDRLVSEIADPTDRLDETARTALESVFLSSSAIEELAATAKSDADYLAFLKRHVTIATAKDDDGRLFLFIGVDGPLANVSRILYRCATVPDGFGLSESMAEAYRRRLPDEFPVQSDDPLVVRVFEGSGPMTARKCILKRLLANEDLARGWLRPLVAPPNLSRDIGMPVSTAFPRFRYFTGTPMKAEVADNMITRLPGFIA